MLDLFYEVDFFSLLAFLYTLSGYCLRLGNNALPTHPSEVACRLQIDEITLARVQGRVPVTVVGVIVPHGERCGYKEAAGR